MHGPICIIYKYKHIYIKFPLTQPTCFNLVIGRNTSKRITVQRSSHLKAIRFIGTTLVTHKSFLMPETDTKDHCNFSAKRPIWKGKQECCLLDELFITRARSANKTLPFVLPGFCLPEQDLRSPRKVLKGTRLSLLIKNSRLHS